LFALSLQAREGMWMPQLLKELNESDMKSMGMQISADEIYSVNHSSLKDAVVQFGGGCTGEIISASGLMITNYHCGFSQIQSLSTLQKNYLSDGYWSEDNSQEIPCPGLTVTFIKNILEVTEIILKDVPDTLNETARNFIVKYRSDSIEKTISGKNKGIVRSFYSGNKYFLFTTQVFSDVRFVGAPPQKIGKFGGETDNWMWPRHTGDFSLFRIYADSMNEPSPYSKNNIPLKTPVYLTISTKGIKENDFAMVMGFPGRTLEYLPASYLEMIRDQTNPNRITIREARLNILRDEMRRNDTIRLLYSAKFATLENSYKKWKGELTGFNSADILHSKTATEKINDDVLKRYNEQVDSGRMVNFANDYYAEMFPSIDLLNIAGKFKVLAEIAGNPADTSQLFTEARRLSNEIHGFYKTYYPSIDKKICAELFNIIFDTVEIKNDVRLNNLLPQEIVSAAGRFKSGSDYSNRMFDNSIFSDSNKIQFTLQSNDVNQLLKIKSDPAFILSMNILSAQKIFQQKYDEYISSLGRIQRQYMNNILKNRAAKNIYPDANGTLRISYGKIEGMNPADGEVYKYYTTTDGILSKSKQDNPDYLIPPKLADILSKKDFGKYGANEILDVAFMTSAHTTGGNSGSPVLNSKGELIGLNYDRLWEGIVSDYYYDEKNSRNICVDIRYVLFIIEKYGNAKRLISEMKIHSD
jgi:hypothetical protein